MATAQCFRCQQFRHIAKNCPVQFSQNVQQNQNTGPTPNQQTSNINVIQESVNAVNMGAKSVPPIRDYDIVPDVWNQHAHVIIGELLANDQYRNDLHTAINTMENRTNN